MRAVVVTGGSAGIGGQLTVSLARAGFEVFFVGRDPTRGRALQNRITDGGDRAHFVRGDLSSQQGVARLAGELRASLAAHGQGLTALVNNLGGVSSVKSLTADGVEATFAHNYVHPLLLTVLLLPELEKAHGRVVQLSTGYHHLVRITRADIAGRRWDCGMNVYGRAKLMAVRVGDVIGQRWLSRGVGWHFADPGMAETPLTRSMGAQDFPWYGRFLVPAVRQIQRPIPLTWCATSTMRLIARNTLPAPTGVYVLPGPFVLPRALVGFDRRQGEWLLTQSYRWFRAPYRTAVEAATSPIPSDARYDTASR